MSVLHTVHLHGELGEKFGKTFVFAVNSPHEAVRALKSQVLGFAEYFKDGWYRLVRGPSADNGVGYDVESLLLSFPKTPQDFHIVPSVAGAKNQGVGKTILGAVILAVAVVGAAFTGGGSLAVGMTQAAGSLGATVGVTWGGIAAFGTAILLSGVSKIMAPSLKTDYSDKNTDTRASSFLGGQTNQSIQGVPVVMSWGHVRVGSTIISAGLSSERV